MIESLLFGNDLSKKLKHSINQRVICVIMIGSLTKSKNRFFKIFGYIRFIIFLILPLNAFANWSVAIDRTELENFSSDKLVVFIASTGRSGSTLLTETIAKYAKECRVVKTHLLPPKNKNMKAKMIFIFSNPDLSAESALHYTIASKVVGVAHFEQMETSDRFWLDHVIGDSTQQTVQNNLLSYDALGCFEHLSEYLYNRSIPCSVNFSNLLAIKYENLWDPLTIQAIKNFLNFSDFELPSHIKRGYSLKQLSSQEILFRNTYNKGTYEDPRYGAYDKAREIWQKAQGFQYLKVL